MLHAAAKSEHLHVLKWLQHRSDHPWTVEEKTEMLLAAVEGGHLNNIQWLRTEGAAWPVDR
jgi:hypothetical protein